MDEDGSSSSTSLLKRDEQSTHLKRQVLSSLPDIKADLSVNRAAGSPPTGAGPAPSPPTGAGPSTGTPPSSPSPSTPSPTPSPTTSPNTPTPPGPDSHSSSSPTPAPTPAPNAATPTPPSNTTSPPAPIGPNTSNNGTATPTISPNSSTPISGGITPTPTGSPNATHPSTTTTSELPTSTGNTTGPIYKPPPKRTKENGIATTTVKTMVLVVGVVAVVYFLWTIIRKWKFKPSRKFEQRLEDYDENLFDPRPPSFGEKRYDSHVRPLSINSASSPSSANRRGNGQYIGDGNYPGPNTSVSGYSQPGPHSGSRVGEFYNHPYETHNGDQDLTNYNSSLVYPPKRGYTLEMDSPDHSHAASMEKEPAIPRPVFESNIHRLSDLSLGAKFGT